MAVIREVEKKKVLYIQKIYENNISTTVAKFKIKKQKQGNYTNPISKGKNNLTTIKLIKLIIINSVLLSIPIILSMIGYLFYLFL